jgi:hypothetical protein
MTFIEKYNIRLWKQRKWTPFALLFYIFLSQNLAFGQIDTVPGRVPPPGSAEDSSASERRGILSDFVDTDSFKVQYYYPGRENDLKLFTDTSLYRYQHFYDPARRRTFDMIHLGVPGTPSRPIWLENKYIRGNLPGIQAYSREHKSALDLPFYKDLPSTFSSLAFLRGADQDDYIFTAQFAQNFENDIQLSLDYTRNAQVGDYSRQRLKNTHFNIGMKFKPWKSVLESYFIFTLNSNLQENNGGVIDPDFYLESGNDIRIGVPTYLDQAQTYIFNRTFALHNDINTDKWIPGLKMKYHISHFSERYKFFDKSDPPKLAAYYTDSLFLTESRGLRSSYTFSTLEQKASAVWASPPIDWFKVEQLQADLIYRNSIWNQGLGGTSFNELYFRASGKLSFSNVLSGGLIWETGLGSAAFNSQLRADVLFKWGKYIALEGVYERNRNLPSLFARSLLLSFTEVYNNQALPEQISNSWEATLQIPFTRTSVTAKLLSLNNALYFNQQFFPQILDNNATIAQFVVSQLLKLWRMYLDVSATLQTSSAPELGIPPIFGKASLYYEGIIFNDKSTFRIGADGRYIKGYNGLGYVPAHSQFYYSGTETLDDYYEVDAFISMRVKVFNVSVRYENLLNAFTGVVGYQHLRYPTQDAGLRIGIQWILLN